MKRLLFSALIFLSFTVYAQEDLLWDYPVKPGTEEWNKLTLEEKRAACQIPEDILLIIPTNQLMTLCLQYPFLYDVFAFNNKLTGLDMLFANFNGIREFSKREGAAVNYMQEQYLSDIHSIPDKLNKSSSLGFSFVYQISILELLLSYSEFHGNTSQEDQKKILGSLLFGYRAKSKFPEYFQGTGFETNLFARAHILIKINPALSEKFEGINGSVLASGMVASAGLIDNMDSLSYELIR